MTYSFGRKKVYVGYTGDGPGAWRTIAKEHRDYNSSHIYALEKWKNSGA